MLNGRGGTHIGVLVLEEKGILRHLQRVACGLGQVEERLRERLLVHCAGRGGRRSGRSVAQSDTVHGGSVGAWERGGVGVWRENGGSMGACMGAWWKVGAWGVWWV
jgi:hypothetical protein